MDSYRINRWLRRARLYAPLHRLTRHVANGRVQYKEDFATFKRLSSDLERVLDGLPAAASRCHQNVLISGWTTLGSIAIQIPIVAAFVRLGYRPVVLLPSRADKMAQSIYRMAGVRDFSFWSELQPSSGFASAEMLGGIRLQSDMVALQRDGIRVGRYALSTMMRNLRRGRFNLADPADRQIATLWLQRSLDAVAFANSLFDRWNPAALLVNDQGYVPQGPLFERSIRKGIPAFTWNAGHRDGTIILKRYDDQNTDEHPTSLSQESWSSILARPWGEADWDSVRDELIDCYQSGQWYAEVGTQFNTSILERQALMHRLRLDPSRPTALVFPHIFWDGTFFWGRDLFSDYEEFFTETLKVAYETPTANWIVKIHPANTVKDRRDGIVGQPGEQRVIEALGPPPPHVRVIDASTDISTLSLFAVGNVCVTVRGTVGLEAACFGLTTLTAGTGRYDHLGFTIDPDTPQEFLDLLRRVDNIQPPTSVAIERARRYAHGVLLERPTRYECMRFSFAHDAVASIRIELDPKRPLFNSPEVAAMADYIRSDLADYLQNS